MDLVSFSIRTKGARNFARRLRTVFSRFGVTEDRTRRALYTVLDLLQHYDGAPTFFVPAVVLRRHPHLLTEVARSGAEIGVHGYVHNDYRLLSQQQQYEQTRQAISVFKSTRVDYQGFRNPYLGWTEEALHVFAALGFTYESNEAVLHPLIDADTLPAAIRSGYKKSLQLYNALPCNAYTLRPHFEGSLLRIPTSIPDDEMLFDRLYLTNEEEIGRIWSDIMQRVYNLGGVYTLNLHPERAVVCRRALDMLLSCARRQPHPVWITRLHDIAQWWKERSQFTLTLTPLEGNRWRVEAHCSKRATLLARCLTVEDAIVTSWSANEQHVHAQRCIVRAPHCPAIGLSAQTPDEVLTFLQEQGYVVLRRGEHETGCDALYLHMPEGLGKTREEQVQRRSSLVEHIEHLDVPLLRFGCWPDGQQAALAISGDIDSVTIQDFFLRVLEVR